MPSAGTDQCSFLLLDRKGSGRCSLAYEQVTMSWFRRDAGIRTTERRKDDFVGEERQSWQ